MARKYVRIGSLQNIHLFDDGAFDGGLETDDTIKAHQAPIAGEDVLRLDDVGVLTGNVIGPGASTDEAIARWNGVSGLELQDSLVTISDTGQIVLLTTARVTKSVWIDAGGLKAPGAKPPDEVSFGSLELPVWQFGDEAVAGNQESISLSMQFPSDMDRSVAPQLCVGWSADGISPGNVEWQLEYLYTAEDEDTSAAAQDTDTEIDAASAISNGLVITPFDDMDLAGASDVCLHAKLKRLSAGANDTIADTVELHGISLVYTSNKLGEAI